MKELIYLDTNFLHSFIAQMQGGLPIAVNIETQEQRVDTMEQRAGQQSSSFTELQGDTGKVEIPGIFSSPSGRITLRVQPGRFSSETYILSELEAGKEIISKQLHDNALEEFERTMRNENKLKDVSETDEIEIGSYIKIVSGFNIIDFTFLQEVLDKLLINVILGNVQNEVSAAKEQIDSEPSLTSTQKKARKKELDKYLEKQKAQLENELSYYRDVITYTSKILPTKSFIKVGKVLAPLKLDYLRDTTKSLYYKYGNHNEKNKVALIGKVTRKVQFSNKNITNPNSFIENIEQIIQSMDDLLNYINVLNKDDYIVAPVAIYFE